MADGLRIAVVDHYPLFRQGVVQTLRRDKNFAVVAEGTTAEEAEQFARDRRPDVLLLEVAVPGSLRAAQAISRSHPKVKVIFLASTEDQEHATQALQAGAHGYILKGITGPELLKAIVTVHQGEHYLTPEMAWSLVTKPAPSPRLPDPVGRAQLSIRERQVLDYTSRGLTNQEIGRMLGLAVSTIKYYKTLAFRKMGARNRLEAIVAANKAVRQT